MFSFVPSNKSNEERFSFSIDIERALAAKATDSIFDGTNGSSCSSVSIRWVKVGVIWWISSSSDPLVEADGTRVRCSSLLSLIFNVFSSTLLGGLKASAKKFSSGWAVNCFVGGKAEAKSSSGRAFSSWTSSNSQGSFSAVVRLAATTALSLACITDDHGELNCWSESEASNGWSLANASNSLLIGAFVVKMLSAGSIGFSWKNKTENRWNIETSKRRKWASDAGIRFSQSRLLWLAEDIRRSVNYHLRYRRARALWDCISLGCLLNELECLDWRWSMEVNIRSVYLCHHRVDQQTLPRKLRAQLEREFGRPNVRWDGKFDWFRLMLVPRLMRRVSRQQIWLDHHFRITLQIGFLPLYLTKDWDSNVQIRWWERDRDEWRPEVCVPGAMAAKESVRKVSSTFEFLE